MSETLGSLIDRLAVVSLKMWNAQEFLYALRRMSFEEYKAEFFETEDGARKLWDHLKKACDLNVQRANIVDDIDKKIVEVAIASRNDTDEELEDKFIQRKHKTY